MRFPPPSELTSHQPPALLVDALLEAAADGSTARSRLLNVAGLDLLQLIEGCAQTVAVLMGATLRAQGGAAAKGMLVGVKDARLDADIPADALVEVEVARQYQLPPFSIYLATVTSDRAVVATIELKTMASPA